MSIGGRSRADTPSDYEDILAADLMWEMVDPDDSRRLRPSCNEPGRGSFVSRAEPVTGTSVRLECLQPVTQVLGTEPGDITIGTACRQGETPDVCRGADLTCDMQTNTCQQSCETDADCTADGLAGWRCDPNGFCRNPTCG